MSFAICRQNRRWMSSAPRSVAINSVDKHASVESTGVKHVSDSTVQTKKQHLRRFWRQHTSQLLKVDELSSDIQESKESSTAGPPKPDICLSDERKDQRRFISMHPDQFNAGLSMFQRMKAIDKPDKRIVDALWQRLTGKECERYRIPIDPKWVLPQPLRLVKQVKTQQDSFPDLSLPEFAFIGRSNVGKSRLLDALTSPLPRKGQPTTRSFRATAPISDEPGTTKSLDFYRAGTLLRCVDMPGYGFANVNSKLQKQWACLLSDYMTAHKTVLKRLFVLVDARWGLLEADRVFLKFLASRNINWQIIMTKCDLVSIKFIAKQHQLVQEDIRQIVGEFHNYRSHLYRGTFFVSSKTFAGMNKLRRLLWRISKKQDEDEMENESQKTPNLPKASRVFISRGAPGKDTLSKRLQKDNTKLKLQEPQNFQKSS